MEMLGRNGHRPNIVVIGGGTGVSSILKGLKNYDVDLSVIVTMFDSGGSSGLLRTEFGLPPFGDLRQCLLALSEDAYNMQALRDALDFRFGQGSSLNGHNIGNLLLAALTSLNGDVEQAVEEISHVLHVKGQVIPVALNTAELCAELEDGHVIQGESDIDLRRTSSPRIKRIYLNPTVQANPRAIRLIEDADGIVLGPGDLYTSVLPNLLVEGMAEAISSSRATRIYVCNLMTKLGETDGFKASDFVREVTRYISPAELDWALVNTVVTDDVRDAYEAEQAYPVLADLDEVGTYVTGIFASPLGTGSLPVRHDPVRATEAIIEATVSGRLNQGSDAKLSSAWVKVD